jgi:hypothetical protein
MDVFRDFRRVKNNTSNLRQSLISSSEKCEKNVRLKFELVRYICLFHTLTSTARCKVVHPHHLRILIFNNWLHKTIQIQQKQNYKFRTVPTLLVWGLIKDADPTDRAVWGVRLQPLAFCDCGFESHRELWMSVSCECVCCQVEVSASGWSLVQRSPTECGVSECDHEASIMKRPWPTRGSCAMEKLIKSFN